MSVILRYFVLSPLSNSGYADRKNAIRIIFAFLLAKIIFNHDLILRSLWKSIRINQPIADALFTFVPPLNAKEVDTFSIPKASARSLPSKPASEFSLPTVEGKNASLSDFKGKTILLDFWTTWCLPCRESTPVIEKLQSAFSEKGLVALAVDAGEEPEVVRGYLAHNPNKLPNLMVSMSTVANLYNVNSFPAFVLISRDGKVVYSSSGFGANSEAQLRAALKQEGIE